jgi:predicted site-specific integrase-resolvase
MTALSTNMSTPPQVAERLRVNVHRVLGWINAGQLRAVNVGDGKLRPRWRVDEADLQSFLSRRSATPSPPPRRRRKLPTVTEYF